MAPNICFCVGWFQTPPITSRRMQLMAYLTQFVGVEAAGTPQPLPPANGFRLTP